MLCCNFKPKKEVDEDGTLSGDITKIDSSMVDKPIIQIFEERIKNGKIPEKKTAIHHGDHIILSYVQLNTIASCLARNIIERLGYDYKITNPDNDLIIAICLPMSEKTISLILACMKTGAAYLPLDPEDEEDHLVKVLSTFKPVMLITDDNGKIYNKYDVDKFSAVCKVMSIEELWLDIEFAHEPKTRRASLEVPWEIDFIEKAAKEGKHPVVIMTSPQSKDKKIVGVRVGNHSILNLVNCHWTRFKMSQKDSCCINVSVSSPISIPQTFIALLLGCTLHLFRRQDLHDMGIFLKNVSWRNISRLSMPTFHLSPLLDFIDCQGANKILKSLKSLKHVICRGDMISLELAKWFFGIFKSGVTLCNCSGSIETTGEIAFEIFDSLKDFESKLVKGQSSLGSVLDNVKIYIVDDNMNLVKDGSKGEICVSGDCLAMGYVGGGSDDLNQFIKNPFRVKAPLDEKMKGFDKLYKTGDYGHIMKGKHRLYMDSETKEFKESNE